MKIVVSPNPYRDKQFKNARQACSILREAGAEVALCLPFDVDKTFEIPHDLRFQDIQKEIKTADMLICFGGDGTILHSSKIATEHNLPILGVNIGTMGFIAELEAGEIELLRKIPKGDYTVEERTMLDVSVGHTFTNSEGDKRITLGVYVTDGYRDTVEDGIAIVKEYIEGLAKDEKTKALVSMVLRLLARDAKGTLKASRIVQLRKVAMETGDDRFIEGVRIIEEAYQPEVSKQFIRAEIKNENGMWKPIPLGMTES